MLVHVLIYMYTSSFATSSSANKTVTTVKVQNVGGKVGRVLLLMCNEERLHPSSAKTLMTHTFHKCIRLSYTQRQCKQLLSCPPDYLKLRVHSTSVDQAQSPAWSKRRLLLLVEASQHMVTLVHIYSFVTTTLVSLLFEKKNDKVNNGRSSPVKSSPR